MSEIFDVNGKYVKTNWMVGDTITASKLNKIEEGLEHISGLNETVNSNTTEIEVCKDSINTLASEDTILKAQVTDLSNNLSTNYITSDKLQSLNYATKEYVNNAVSNSGGTTSTVDLNIINVEEHGCVSDGSTDNLSALKTIFSQVTNNTKIDTITNTAISHIATKLTAKAAN